MIFRRFNEFRLPETWQSYWTAYPEGRTILEALMGWIDNMNLMTVNLTDMNEELKEFIELFGPRLESEVKDLLTDWYNSGKLASMVAEIVLEINTRFDGYVRDVNADIAAFKDEINAVTGGLAGRVTALESGNQTNVNADKLDGKHYSDIERSAVNRPTFSFIFDSGFADNITAVLPAFKSRGLQVGFALAPQELQRNRPNKWRMEFINEWTKAYFEGHCDLMPIALSHGAIGSEDTLDARGRNEILGAYHAFGRLGITPNGWASPMNKAAAKFKPYLRAYKYAYNVPSAISAAEEAIHYKGADLHNLKRVHFGTLSEEMLTEIVTKTVATNGFVCFYAHTQDDTANEKDYTIERLNWILDLIAASGGVVMSPDDAINTYYGVGMDRSQPQVHNNIIPLDPANIVDTATTAIGKWYIPPPFVVEGNKIIWRPTEALAAGTEHMLYYNMAGDLTDAKDFASQLMTQFKVQYGAPTSNPGITVTVQHGYYATGVTTRLVNDVRDIWHEPEDYITYSHPHTDDARAGHIKIIVRVKTNVSRNAGAGGEVHITPRACITTDN